MSAPEDRSQRQDRVTDAACRQSLSGELVGEVLQHRVADRGQPLHPERWQNAMVQRLPVGAKRRGLVRLPCACADDARLSRRKPRLRRLGERQLRGRAEQALAQSNLAFMSPTPRGGQRRERLSDRLLLGCRPHLRLIARAARTPPACTGAAAACVTQNNPLIPRSPPPAQRALRARLGFHVAHR